MNIVEIHMISYTKKKLIHKNILRKKIKKTKKGRGKAKGRHML